MKKFKFLCVVLTCTMILAFTSIVANAAGRQPYSSITIECDDWILPFKDHSYSRIYKNSDIPVSNYLYVYMEVQYKSGNQYIWDDATNAGSDVKSIGCDIWQYDTVCNCTRFYASAAGCDTYDETLTVPLS